MHNGGVGHGLHHAAGQDSQDVAVAGAVVDLLVEGFGVGAEAANHGGVILVCAGGQDDGLGVDLHESTGGILADTAHHGAVLLDQLDNGGGVVDIQHVAVLLGGVVQDAGDQSAEVVGLGAEPGGEDLHLVLAEVPALGAVHPDAGEHGVGGLVDLHAGLLVLVAQLAFQAALLAEEPQGIFGILNVSVDQPGIASPSIGGDAHILPAGDAAGGGAALDNGGSAVALGVGDGLLLQHHDLLALVQRLHGSHDTGSTGTADHDVAVDLLGEVLDLPHHHGGGVHILGDEVGGDKGALGGQNLLDVAVNDGSAALGLGDALLQAGLGSIGGDGGGGNAVDVGALGTQQLLDDGVLGGLTDGGGLLGQIQVDGDDAVGIKDRGHLHGAHALGGGGVGAGGVDALSGGFAHTAQNTGGGQTEGTGSGALQKISAGEIISHCNYLLSLYSTDRSVVDGLLLCFLFRVLLVLLEQLHQLGNLGGSKDDEDNGQDDEKLLNTDFHFISPYLLILARWGLPGLFPVREPLPWVRTWELPSGACRCRLRSRSLP